MALYMSQGGAALGLTHKSKSLSCRREQDEIFSWPNGDNVTGGVFNIRAMRENRAKPGHRANTRQRNRTDQGNHNQHRRHTRKD